MANQFRPPCGTITVDGVQCDVIKWEGRGVADARTEEDGRGFLKYAIDGHWEGLRVEYRHPTTKEIREVSIRLYFPRKDA